MTILDHKPLGRAGTGQRVQSQHSLNRWINTILYGERWAFPPEAMIVQQKRFPDVSYYQGNIDWDRLAAKTNAVIIRAGQNTWKDTMFLCNYGQAKRRGMLRGVYWFYDDRASPGDQAKALVELLKGDLPEMGIFIDWENTYGGQFGGLRNVVAMMQAVESAVPCKVGMYTGYYWFIEHTNAVTNAAQYKYLKDRELWLGYYAQASAVKIPPPWTVITHWQYGTPSEDWGQASYEIDMNYFNGTEAEFNKRYGLGGVVETPPEEVSMAEYVIVWDKGANERTGPSTWEPTTGRVYAKGETIKVVELRASGTDVWGKLENGKYVALVYASTVRASVVVPDPDPANVPDWIEAHWVGGEVKRYVPE